MRHAVVGSLLLLHLTRSPPVSKLQALQSLRFAVFYITRAFSKALYLRQYNRWSGLLECKTYLTLSQI